MKHQVREERQKAESIALYQTQIRGTDALLLHMPKLGEYLDEWSLDGPGTIQWSDKNTAILGEGGFGKVRQPHSPCQVPSSADVLIIERNVPGQAPFPGTAGLAHRL